MTTIYGKIAKALQTNSTKLPQLLNEMNSIESKNLKRLKMITRTLSEKIVISDCVNGFRPFQKVYYLQYLENNIQNIKKIAQATYQNHMISCIYDEKGNYDHDMIYIICQNAKSIL